MMLHRHFEQEKPENLTTLADVTPTEKEKFVSSVFPPEKEATPKRRKTKKD